MKKIISFLLLISLLIVPLSSCELLDSILPDAPDETTTPNATTPADTTPTNPDNTTPSDSIDPTTPDATTPTDTPDVTPPTDATERNLVTELFGDETIELMAPVFVMDSAFSSNMPLAVGVENGKIRSNGCYYKVSLVEKLSLTYLEEWLWWGVEKDEQVLEAYQKLKNTTSYYRLEAETDTSGSMAFQVIEVCIIDDVHYFIAHTQKSHQVTKVYYAVIE